MSVTRIFDILDYYHTEYPDKADAFGVKRNGKWIRVSIDEYYHISNKVSIALLSHEVKPLDNIVTVFSANIPEWNYIDIGILQVGAVHIPVYPNISFSDFDYIFKECEPKFVFISDVKLYDSIIQILRNIKSVKKIILIKKTNDSAGWNEFLKSGEIDESKYLPLLQEIKAGVKPEQLASVIYTSGTTGFPKGVMLSHQNIVSNVLTATELHPLREKERILSFLPLCHVYERTANYQFQYHGISIYYAEGIKSLSKNILEIKPNGIITVPRFLEKILQSVTIKAKELRGFKKVIFQWAIKFGYRFNPEKKHSWLYNLKLLVATKAVFSKWRKMLGGNLQYIGCGGAQLNQRIEQIFWAAGMPIYQGYGLTECSPLISLNYPPASNVKLGTVGKIIKGVEIKFGTDDEILCKGPNIMMGYYKQEELTKKSFENGWLMTGDTGVLVDNNFLKLTGRKKEMFKTSYGKYVVPHIIENKLRESVIIDQAFVVGEGKQYAAVIISPNFEYLYSWLSKKKIYPKTNTELLKNQKVIRFFEKEIEKTNKHFGQFDKIKNFRLVSDEWEVSSGELIANLKLKRRFLAEKYEALIAEMFEEKF